MPEWLIPLGPTLGWPSNGAVSNLAPTPGAVTTLRRELRSGGYDVVHLHEPVAPVIGVGRAELGRRSRSSARSTATPRASRRTRSRRCSAPGASSTGWQCGSRCPTLRPGPAGASTAASTGSSRTACTLPEDGAPAPRRRAPGEPLEIAFVGQAVERKGLPILMRAFEARARARARAAHHRGRLRDRGRAAAASSATGVTVAGPRFRRGEARRAGAPRTCWRRRRSAASRSAWS